MPYIRCEDGEIYSRYDQSPYVIECIRAERVEAEFATTECLADPSCSTPEEQVQEATVFYTIIVLFTVIILLPIIAMNSRE